jgi:thioredoxin reductase (NADPH)
VSPPRPTVHVVGHRLEPEHHRLRDFLTRAAQPHEFYEAGSPQAEAVLAKAGARGAELPVVVDGGAVYPGIDVRASPRRGTCTRGRPRRTTTW